MRCLKNDIKELKLNIEKISEYIPLNTPSPNSSSSPAAPLQGASRPNPEVSAGLQQDPTEFTPLNQADNTRSESAATETILLPSQDSPQTHIAATHDNSVSSMEEFVPALDQIASSGSSLNYNILTTQQNQLGQL